MNKIKQIINKEIEDSLNTLSIQLISESYLPVINIAEKIDINKCTETDINCTGQIIMLFNENLSIKRRIEILQMLLDKEKKNLTKLN